MSRHPGCDNTYDIYHQLYLLRAGVFEQQEDYLQAAKILEVILRFAPNDEQMRLRVAMDYSMAEEFENAIKHVNVAIQGNNESWLAYYSRADIYLSMGEHAKAIEGLLNFLFFFDKRNLLLSQFVYLNNGIENDNMQIKEKLELIVNWFQCHNDNHDNVSIL